MPKRNRRVDTPAGALLSLNRMALELDSPKERSSSGQSGAYSGMLDSALFQSDLRFVDYHNDQDEATFPTRLERWFSNVTTRPEKRSLFHLLENILFVDDRQFLALNRLAFREIVCRWLVGENPARFELLNPAFYATAAQRLRSYSLFSITESAEPHRFVTDNLLAGNRVEVLGEDVKVGREKVLANLTNSTEGVIVIEDLVATGTQAACVLRMLTETAMCRRPVLFVPLIAMEAGIAMITHEVGEERLEIRPVMKLGNESRVAPTAQPGEPRESNTIRAIVKKTRRRVLARNPGEPDPPLSPFGFRETGSLLVTCRNAPDNSLLLIHRKTPVWNPLFPRVTR